MATAIQQHAGGGRPDSSGEIPVFSLAEMARPGVVGGPADCFEVEVSPDDMREALAAGGPILVRVERYAAGVTPAEPARLARRGPDGRVDQVRILLPAPGVRLRDERLGR